MDLISTSTRLIPICIMLLINLPSKRQFWPVKIQEKRIFVLNRYLLNRNSSNLIKILLWIEDLKTTETSRMNSTFKKAIGFLETLKPSRTSWREKKKLSTTQISTTTWWRFWGWMKRLDFTLNKNTTKTLFLGSWAKFLSWMNEKLTQSTCLGRQGADTASNYLSLGELRKDMNLTSLVWSQKTL